MKGAPSRIDPSEVLLTEAGAYRLIEPLGEGGNASAYLALGEEGRDRGLPFAIKFFLHPDDARRAGFMKEIDFLRDPHPAILRVSGSGRTTDGVPFYVSRYMATTLERRIREENVPLLDKLLYATQLCAALGWLAKQDPQILHVDIKAENVFVNGRTCVLGDFGMVRLIGDASVPVTLPTKARTPDLYRAKKGVPLTVASDVFALGVLLYRLFTGEERLEEKMKLAKRFSVGGRYADELDNVLERMVCFEPEDRIDADRASTVFMSLVHAESQRRL